MSEHDGSRRAAVREQDTGEACIPVSVIEQHIPRMWPTQESTLVYWRCRCGWSVEAPYTDARDGWLAHLVAFAPAQGTAEALPAEVVAQQDILAAIMHERHRQDAKFGEFRHNDPRTWLAVLGEEYGEVCQAVLEAGPSRNAGFGTKTIADVQEELIQVAAVCVAFLEDLMSGVAAHLDEQRPWAMLAGQPLEAKLPAAVVALLRDYWFDLSDHENNGTQDWRRDRLKRISALLAGQPDAEGQ